MVGFICIVWRSEIGRWKSGDEIVAKSYNVKHRMVAMIAAAKFSIWRLGLSDSDKNLHKNIIWIKLSVYFELAGDSYIKLQNNIGFWYKIKYLIKDWVPSQDANSCNHQRPCCPTLAGTLTDNINLGLVHGSCHEQSMWWWHAGGPAMTGVKINTALLGCWLSDNSICQELPIKMGWL